MLERFTVDGFVNAIKTHRIKRSGVQPAVIRMLLDADVPKEDLASLEFLISASGPLDPETRDEFEKHFEIPVRLAYGATEFAGSLCAWTPGDIDRFGESKRDSVGRPLPDTHVRVVDPDTGAELPAGEHGLLEAKVAPDQSRLDPHHGHRVDRHGRLRHTARQGRRRDQPRRLQDPAGNRSARADLTPGSARRLRGRRARQTAGPGAVRGDRDHPWHAGPVRRTNSRTLCARRCPFTTSLSISPSWANSRATRR